MGSKKSSRKIYGITEVSFEDRRNSDDKTDWVKFVAM